MKLSFIFLLAGFLSLNGFSQVVANQPPNIFVCDDDSNNGYENFNLLVTEYTITGGSGDVFVTYYTSQYSADNSIDQINNPGSYTNQGNPQTIYARVESISTGEYNTTSFQIIVSWMPFPVGPYEVFKCDDNIADGITNFDAASLGFSPIVTHTFHRTQSDADNNTNPLPDVFYNETPYNDAFYVRMGVGMCYRTTVIYVEVKPQVSPLLNPSPLTLCDDNYDGIASFALNDKTSEILNGGSGGVTYHPSNTDASSNINRIGAFSSYVNITPYRQTVYARVSNSGSGCFVEIVPLDLLAQDCRDQDNDNVINSDEDINGSGNLDDDDTDLDTIPNYLDDDDDGDKIDTLDELVDQSSISGKSSSSKSIAAVIDTDGDKIPNYLDDDDDDDGILTKDEDYNNNGSPLDDDTNNNNVPDYLEKGVALSVNKINKFEFLISPNPASDFIALNFSKNMGSTIRIDVYGIQGKQIINTIKTVNNKSVNLRISELSKGLYFLKVNDGISEITQKLIIK